MHNIVFISGLSGTGKSTLKEYFDQNAIAGYRVYDFDKGKYECPEDERDHLRWRTDQTKHWLEVGAKNLEQSLGTIVFGLSLYPQNIIEMAEKLGIEKSSLKFGYLITDDEERRKRLFDRGTPHHWKGEQDWYEEFYRKLKEVEAQEFDSSNESTEALSREITDWIEA